nr:integrating conjugative element protein [Serratia marcescens]
MKKVNFLLFGLSLVTTTALANLNVIADIGGDDASPYFEGINRQGDAVAPPAMTQSPASASASASASADEVEVAVLPVTTPELMPGVVAARPLQLPGIGALFIVGDDDASRLWLQANAEQLKSRHAAGLVVNVSNLPALQALRELAPGVPVAPASGSELARRLQLSNYPVLITDTGLSQQVTP